MPTVAAVRRRVVAIDGSKFKAVNNRDKNFSHRKIEVRRQQLEHSINRYLAELDRADRQPELVLPERVSRLKERIGKLQEQMHELGQMEERLQTSGERQVWLTDPDARSMATSRLGSAVVGYNVQAAVDAKHHMIVAHEVTNSITDQGQLIERLVPANCRHCSSASRRGRPEGQHPLHAYWSSRPEAAGRAERFNA